MKFAAILIVALAITISGCSKAPVVDDANFETPQVVQAIGYDTYTPGTKIGPWQVLNGSVDLVGKYWRAASGAQSINLRGGNTRASIVQELNTEPGQHYVLRFALAGNPDNGPGEKKMEIWWDDKYLDTVTFGVEEQTHQKMGWKYISLNVTADKEKTKLRFTSAVDEPWGPVIDDVQLMTNH